MKKYLKYIPAIVYMMLIWFLSSQQIGYAVQGYDKTAHITEYAVLGFLWMFALWDMERNVRHVFIISIIWGALDELHQYFVPTRSMDVLDWIADIVGVMIGILIFSLIFSLINKIKEIKD